MSFSFSGLRISLGLLAFCSVLFFYNATPKFLVPFRYVQKKIYIAYLAFLSISFLCVVLLPLRFSFVSDKRVVVQKNIPIQLLLDVSLSMSANDIVPSRFVVAKKSLISLVQQLDGYYISLIAFSGKSVVTIPFSSSSSAIVSKLTDINLADFPLVKDFLWTAIGDAMLLWVQNLQHFVQQETYKPWIVILITDGDSNIWFDPMQVLSYYKKMHVPIFVLGVGQENYLIGRDTWNADIVTTIDLPLLQKLAEDTGGKFYRILGDTSFETFFAQLSQNILSQQQHMIKNIYWELNPFLMYLLVFTLFGLFGLRLYISSLKK